MKTKTIQMLSRWPKLLVRCHIHIYSILKQISLEKMKANPADENPLTLSKKPNPFAVPVKVEGQSADQIKAAMENLNTQAVAGSGHTCSKVVKASTF